MLVTMHSIQFISMDFIIKNDFEFSRRELPYLSDVAYARPLKNTKLIIMNQSSERDELHLFF